MPMWRSDAFSLRGARANGAAASLAEAAAAAGYASQSHMGVSFRKATRLTPMRARADSGAQRVQLASAHS